MTKETFSENFNSSLNGIIEFTQEFVINTLPNQFKFILVTNCSFDENLEEGEEVFPEDKIDEASEFNPSSKDQVIEHLWRDGKVPEWINVSIDSCDSKYTYVKLECSGRFSASEKHLYHKNQGHPPFQVLGPSIPAKYIDLETDELIEKVDLNELKKNSA